MNRPIEMDSRLLEVLDYLDHSDEPSYNTFYERRMKLADELVSYVKELQGTLHKRNSYIRDLKKEINNLLEMPVDGMGLKVLDLVAQKEEEGKSLT